MHRYGKVTRVRFQNYKSNCIEGLSPMHRYGKLIKSCVRFEYYKSNCIEGFINMRHVAPPWEGGKKW